MLSLSSVSAIVINGDLANDAVGEVGLENQFSAHRLDNRSKRGNHHPVQVALQPGNRRLTDAEPAGENCLAHVSQGGLSITGRLTDPGGPMPICATR